MKKIILGLFVSAIAFSASAAELMPKAEFEKVKDQYVKVGDISTSQEMSPSDAKEELSEKADKLGGDVFVVIYADSKEKIYGKAEVFKKK